MIVYYFIESKRLDKFRIKLEFIAEEMKQSSAEQQARKLKQARLPFQILSPGVKNPEVSSPQRKRKASDSLLDNNVNVVEITDIKENHETPVEKKAKVVIGDVVDKEASDLKTDGVGEENGIEESVDVGSEKKTDIQKSVVSKTPVAKKRGRPKGSITPSTSAKKNKTDSSGKKVKIVEQKGICENKNTKTETITFIDLCDSPVKTSDRQENVPQSTLPKYKDENPTDVTFKEQSKKTAAMDSKSEEQKTKKNSKSENEVKSTEETEIVERNELDSRSISRNDETKVKSEENDVTKDKCDSENSSKDDLNCSSSRVSQSSLDSSPRTPSSTGGSLTNGGTPPDTTPTPGTSAKKSFKSPLTTPRRKTPMQLKKMKEIEEKKKEKERLKQEKEKKKAEEKEERKRQKQEKEEEKQKLKQEKEEEKRKEKEEREKKKQAEIEQKNEEKRLKEEEKQMKAEEKRAKEEEKKKKEEEEKKKKEEKKLKEEQKEAEKRKSAQAFASFFVKSETKMTTDENKETAPVESSFQPFEVKNDMRLAPLTRVQLSEERREALDTVVDCTACGSGHRLYLEEVKSPSYTKGSAATTWPAPDDSEDDVIIIESEKPNEEIEMESAESQKKSEKKRHRAKLLQFHENRRPPYWGTWRKRSKYIRPRAPLSQDKTMFEYDVDSDDEWEEPEDGESLRGSEDEESQDEQYEEDNDMFVPHGYLSDEEGQDELDDKSPETMKARLKFLQLEFEAERKEKQEKLKPRLIGCVWFCNSESDSSAVGSYIAELFLSRRAVWDGSLPISIAAPPPHSPNTSLETNNESEDARGAKKRIVHESLMPHIIRKVHGNRRKLTRMLNELLEEQHGHIPQPSKRCLADKIREIASWTHSSETGHHCWYVKEEVRQTHGLMDLIIESPPPLPSTPVTPTTNITKFTKVLTSDERLKLLRDSSTLTKDPSKTPNSKSTTPKTKIVTPSAKATPSMKLTPNKSGPTVKKRATLLPAPRGQLSAHQSPSTLMGFVQTVARPSKSEEDGKTLTGSKDEERTKTGEKEKKRITPITLSTFVNATKPQSVPSPSGEEIIVLDD